MDKMKGQKEEDKSKTEASSSTFVGVTTTTVSLVLLVSYTLAVVLFVYGSNYNIIFKLTESLTLVQQNFLTIRDQEQLIEPKTKCIWPEDCTDNSTDRILNQLELTRTSDRIFKILPPADHIEAEGQEFFFKNECKVNKCQITYDSDEADALIFQNSDVLVNVNATRRKDQVWIAYFLESPPHTFDRRFQRLHRGKHEFNWTASYRLDSDLVTPYAKFVPFEHKTNEYQEILGRSNFHNDRRKKEIFYESSSDKHKRMIEHKAGKVAWFASNCNADNDRLEYARELSKYIQVDIYGKCGDFTCDKWNHTNCASMVNTGYKFYLSFENSNCRHYITEKLFSNALGYNDPDYLLVPIVMGPPQIDYEQVVPPGSYIHVDQFNSAKELAMYLHHLDLNDPDYYAYFYWKTIGHFVETKFLCRVCALLHYSVIQEKRKSYSNIKDWWNYYESQKTC